MSILVHLAIHAARAIAEQRKAAARRARRPRTSQAPAPGSPAPPLGFLVVDFRREPTEGALDVRLRAGGGGVWLVLCESPPDAQGWREGVLEAADRRDGAPFLRAVADWLRVPMPKVPLVPHGLRPFAVTWRTAPTQRRGVDCAEVRLAWRGKVASFVLEHPAGSALARIGETDPARRQDLAEILAVVLRDGAPA